MEKGIRFIPNEANVKDLLRWQTLDLGDRVESSLQTRNLMSVLDNLLFQMLLFICLTWKVACSDLKFCIPMASRAVIQDKECT